MVFIPAIGVLRMIKLFGWEEKMIKRIEDKREDELGWLWKVKVSQIYNVMTSILMI